MKKIFVGLLNWNRRDDLHRLIGSVLRDLSDQFRYDCKIFVIDNASTDDSVAMVRAEFPRIGLIVNPVNLGGSGGFNTALRYAAEENFDFAWLLDNDAEVLPNAFQGLVDAMESDRVIALVGSKILHRDDPRVVCEIGANISPLTTFPAPKFPNVLNETVNAGVIDVHYVAICSALVRVNAIRFCGILDEKFFLMWDDMEWGMRIRRFGYRVVATNASQVVHPGFSERQMTPMFVYYAWRNHLYFIAVTYTGMRRILHISHVSGLLLANMKRHRRTRFNIPLSDAYEAAFLDFWAGTLGKCTRNFKSSFSEPENVAQTIVKPEIDRTVLLSADRSVATVMSVLAIFKRNNPSTRVIVVVNYRRRHLFDSINPDDLWLMRGNFIDLIFASRIRLNQIDSVIRFQGERAVLLFSLPNRQYVISDTGDILSVSTSSLAVGVMELLDSGFFRLLDLTLGVLASLYKALKSQGFRDVVQRRRILDVCFNKITRKL